MIRRTYTELLSIPDFNGRFEYLKLSSVIGEPTFGYDRYINQRFYVSTLWKRTRRDVIARDYGCDLAHPDFPIAGSIVVHHMNPIVLNDILNSIEIVCDLEQLISVSSRTHRAIHVGNPDLLVKLPVTRYPGDTTLWR